MSKIKSVQLPSDYCIDPVYKTDEDEDIVFLESNLKYTNLIMSEKSMMILYKRIKKVLKI